MKIEGVTHDNAGAVLGSCQCFLFKYNLTTHVFTPTGSMATSDATSGFYSFTGIGDSDPAYCVAFFKDGSPNVFDITDRNLTPVSEAWTPTSAGSRLEYWFDASQATSCYTDVGMTTPCTNSTRAARFRDFSGKGQHLEQATANIRPMFGTANTINGKQALRIAPTDGAGGGLQYMDMIGTPPTLTLPCVTFTVFQAFTATPGSTPGLWVNGTCIMMQRHISLGDKANYFSQSDAQAAQSTIRPIVQGTNYALYAKTLAASVALKVTGDSVEVTHAAAPAAPHGFHLGPWDPADSTTALDALIGEIFTISNFNAGDITGAGTYLQAKWGVQP